MSLPEYWTKPVSTVSFMSLAQIKTFACAVASALVLSSGFSAYGQESKFSVVAFYTAKNDRAHITYVEEANRWLPQMGTSFHFSYTATNDWTNLNDEFLSKYQVVIFLDTRPEAPEQRAAFQRYMERGGSWIGFHFAAFALNNSDFPQNWYWYHNTFLGSGEYKSNTWRPTSAILSVATRRHPVVKKLPMTFTSTPNEWYRWSNDLKKNKDIQVLLSIDSASFPLGTGPKPDEIWRSGYYPVAWTNKKFNMIYINMGHNDIDYENKTNRQLSSSFGSDAQNNFLINSILWLGSKSRIKVIDKRKIK